MQSEVLDCNSLDKFYDIKNTKTFSLFKAKNDSFSQIKNKGSSRLMQTVFCCAW